MGTSRGGNLPSLREWRNKTQKNVSPAGGRIQFGQNIVHPYDLDGSPAPPLQQPPQYTFNVLAGGHYNPSLVPNHNNLENHDHNHDDVNHENDEKARPPPAIVGGRAASSQSSSSSSSSSAVSPPSASSSSPHYGQTIRRRFKLGKSKTHRLVSVLIPNHTHRRHVVKEHQALRNTPDKEIRTYLQKKGLIKVGCEAPRKVLEELYAASKLTGADIINHSRENLLYNFINGTNASSSAAEDGVNGKR
jgi:hypothetical protein